MRYYLVESDVVAAQRDGSTDNPSYVHNNLLRHNFDNASGALLNAAVSGTHQHVITSLPWDDAAWTRENCQVIVFLRSWDANGREIFNAVAVDVP